MTSTAFPYSEQLSVAIQEYWGTFAVRPSTPLHASSRSLVSALTSMPCLAQSTGAPVSPSAALRGAPSWAVYQSNTSAAQGGSSAPTVQLLAPLVESADVQERFARCTFWYESIAEAMRKRLCYETNPIPNGARRLERMAAVRPGAL